MAKRKINYCSKCHTNHYPPMGKKCKEMDNELDLQITSDQSKQSGGESDVLDTERGLQKFIRV